ncbi:hypothetical protein [Garciella nitratireducens]|uniref:Phage gp6-like head-tail connector protein n=1 Tax=Garciella nitratireducens DSM 15102 TaxID=1121911 RepID=A0A1T4K6A2_9FIRM|nr:hypothetical protein [Garciella nitratireducens]SJZ37970.1 hypothetical protein SAMN02745973_00372 [Garciella nitratireducens DSM 15102]
MTILDRVKLRVPRIDETLANEFIISVQDRIKLRLELDEYPHELDTIVVEVVQAMNNRHEMNHEGVESESVDVFSIKFIDDLLSQYDSDLQGYINKKKNSENASRGVLRFL